MTPTSARPRPPIPIQNAMSPPFVNVSAESAPLAPPGRRLRPRAGRGSLVAVRVQVSPQLLPLLAPEGDQSPRGQKDLEGVRRLPDVDDLVNRKPVVPDLEKLRHVSAPFYKALQVKGHGAAP